MFANKTLASFCLTCPKCDAGIPEPRSGSFNWDVNDECPAKIECPSCQTILTVPKGISK